MRYGEFLDALRALHTEWAQRLPNHAALQRLIYALHVATSRSGAARVDMVTKISARAVKESDFFREIEGEIEKVELYALESLDALKKEVIQLEEAQKKCSPRSMRKIADTVSVLSSKSAHLEKFVACAMCECNAAPPPRPPPPPPPVNVSYTTFYKILKKHDKLLPNVPCRQFYMARLNQKCWLRELDTLQADLRAIQVKAMGGPSTGLKGDVAAQSLHSYWIHAGNVGLVKRALSRRFPPVRSVREMEAVFGTDQEGGEGIDHDLLGPLEDIAPEVDSVLHNVVFLDNYRLELYHRRLEQFSGGGGGLGGFDGNGCSGIGRTGGGGGSDRDGWPVEARGGNGGFYGGGHGGGNGGIEPVVIRLRWVGLQSRTVTVERVTYSSRAEMIGTESFELPEDFVLPFLQGRMVASDMRQLAESQGKPSEVESSLFDSVLDQMDAKQMLPMMRVQYCRHAYRDQTGMQFLLDSSILMVKEGPLDHLASRGRWCRDPASRLSPSELHRFPHAVLSVVVPGTVPGVALPDWVENLENVGILRRVDKFDKYLHGAAAVLPELAQSVPYWFGDASLQASLLSSSTADGTVPAMTKMRVSARDMGAQSGDGLMMDEALVAGPSDDKLIGMDGTPILGDGAQGSPAHDPVGTSAVAAASAATETRSELCEPPAGEIQAVQDGEIQAAAAGDGNPKKNVGKPGAADAGAGGGSSNHSGGGVQRDSGGGSTRDSGQGGSTRDSCGGNNRDSVGEIQRAGEEVSASADKTKETEAKSEEDANVAAAAKEITSTAIASAVAAEERRRYNSIRHGTGLVGGITWVLGDRPPCPEMFSNKYKPKDFLANERTFLSWLHAGVTVGSAATAIIAFAAASTGADAHTVLFMQQLGVVLLLASVAVIVYGLLVFHARARFLALSQAAQWSDRRGTFAIATVTIVVMWVIAARGFARMEGIR
eukprot:jgi/Mesvir1/17529/Mv08781-RA.1